METTTMGYIGYIGIILGYIGIMEKKMEAASLQLIIVSALRLATAISFLCCPPLVAAPEGQQLNPPMTYYHQPCSGDSSSSKLSYQTPKL